eukprot:scaffold3591_cov159-Amphora_coffeaeformis.AAC.7
MRTTRGRFFLPRELAHHRRRDVRSSRRLSGLRFRDRRTVGFVVTSFESRIASVTDSSRVKVGRDAKKKSRQRTRNHDDEICTSLVLFDHDYYHKEIANTNLY